MLPFSPFRLYDGDVEVEIASVSVTSAGLLRVAAETALTNPRLSYAAASDTVAMEAGDFINVTGPNGTMPILPFDLTPAKSRLSVEEHPDGLYMISGPLSETLAGLSGDDTLVGNAGHDTFIGGWGADEMYGGVGRDLFVFGADGSLDTVHDFNVAQDAIGLTGRSAEGVNYRAHDGGLELTTANGERILLKDLGLEDADNILFHTLGTEGANDLTGHAGNDRIFALGGDDRIDMGAGYDRITTGAGADVVAFGTGYDTNIVYDFDINRDSVQLSGTDAASLTIRPYKGTDLEFLTSEGDRLVLRDVSVFEASALTIIDAPPTVGFLNGTIGADILRGTALDELIEGFGGTDRLYGGGGADVFVFREESGLNVVYDFEPGEDRILVAPEAFKTLSILSYGNSDAEVRLGSGDRLVLRDIDAGDLSVVDFVFSVPEAFL